MKKDMIIRTVILVLALANQALVMSGKSPIPVDDAALTGWLSTAFTAAAAVWAWWKNNSWTSAAQKADEVMTAIKIGAITETDVDSIL